MLLLTLFPFLFTFKTALKTNVAEQQRVDAAPAPGRLNDGLWLRLRPLSMAYMMQNSNVALAL
jgi:hypothetical protein